jgi:hypothetical protein
MSHSIFKRQLTQTERENLSSYSDLEAHLLFHRGISTNEEAEHFLNPKYDLHSHPAESLKDIDKGVTRVLDAMKKK